MVKVRINSGIFNHCINMLCTLGECECVCVCVCMCLKPRLWCSGKRTHEKTLAVETYYLYIYVMYDSVLSYKLIFLKLIISLRGEDWVHTTSVTPPTFFLLKCLYQARKVRGHIIVSFYDFSVGLWNVPTVWYYLFSILLSSSTVNNQTRALLNIVYYIYRNSIQRIKRLLRRWKNS